MLPSPLFSYYPLSKWIIAPFCWAEVHAGRVPVLLSLRGAAPRLLAPSPSRMCMGCMGAQPNTVTASVDERAVKTT